MDAKDFAFVALGIAGCGPSVAPVAEPRPAAPDTIPVSSHDAQADLEKLVHESIDARRNELWACYRKGLRDSSPIEGHVTIVLEIAQDGRATRVLEGRRTGIDDDAVKCMSRVFKARPFHDGAASTMRLQIPFTFTKEGS